MLKKVTACLFLLMFCIYAIAPTVNASIAVATPSDSEAEEESTNVQPETSESSSKKTETSKKKTTTKSTTQKKDATQKETSTEKKNTTQTKTTTRKETSTEKKTTTQKKNTTKETTETSHNPDPTWNLQVLSDVDLSENDKFSFTLNNDRGLSSTYTINANNLIYSPQTYSLPEGEYTVSNIVYHGNNSDIKKSGYGINKRFSLSAKENKTSYIYIGKTQITMQDQSSLLIKQGEKIVEKLNPVNNEISTENTEATEAAAIGTTQENTTENIESSTEAIKQDPKKEDVVEVIKKESKDDVKDETLFKPFKFISILIIGAIGFIAIYIWDKKR